MILCGSIGEEGADEDIIDLHPDNCPRVGLHGVEVDRNTQPIAPIVPNRQTGVDNGVAVWIVGVPNHWQ